MMEPFHCGTVQKAHRGPAEPMCISRSPNTARRTAWSTPALSPESTAAHKHKPLDAHLDLHEGGGGIVVDTAQALRFAVDVARGMAFLHSLERIIPQYHLNSRHVMVISFFFKFFFRIENSEFIEFYTFL